MPISGLINVDPLFDVYMIKYKILYAPLVNMTILIRSTLSPSHSHFSINQSIQQP
jgi:hypothetical protein